jgi:hypothetical protein
MPVAPLFLRKEREMEKRLYELINPSDNITFRATVGEAACIADRMRSGMYFVRDVETGTAPEIEDMQAYYDAIWTDAARLASYADAYDSFLVGSLSERQLFEDATARMSPAEREIYRTEYHDRRRTSMNDICRQVWACVLPIRSYEPETA